MATAKDTTGKSIDEAFAAFHEANPEIYTLIIKQAKRALRAGKKKFSVRQIVEWIRWEFFIETKEPTTIAQGKLVGTQQKSAYKINNNYSSRYSRKLVKDYPEFEQYIEMRELKS